MSVSLRAGPADGAVQLNRTDLITVTATSVTIQQPLTLPGQLTSTVATGTAPFAVSSTTPVTNLSIGGNAGTATSATNAAVTAVSTNAAYYPTFVSATSGSLALGVDTGLAFNPSTNTLTTTTFVGALTGTATNATNLTGSGTVSATATGGQALTPTTAANALLGGFYGASWQATAYASGTAYTSPAYAIYVKFILLTTASQGYYKYSLVIGGVTIVNNQQLLSVSNNANFYEVNFIVPANTSWTFTNAVNQSISAQFALQ
jgi:hypothetical protein